MTNGILKQNGVHLKDHEHITVKLLLKNGFDVELIPPSEIKGLKNPDIMLMGMAWEMKSPEGGGRNTIKNTVQNASHQAQNIIIDLRRCKMPDEKALKELKQRFLLSKRLKRMKVICSNEQVIDFIKNTKV